ncbi:SDR family NAD(P)-dependent oxidoreductase, partial [Chryseobacterium sp. VD8]
MKLLEGKVALITGATRGIGKGIAEMYAEQGAKVAFTYAGSVEKAKELEAALSSVTQIKGYQSDASDFDAAQTLVDEVMAEFGKIDILVNNAGITKDNLLLRMSKD